MSFGGSYYGPISFDGSMALRKDDTKKKVYYSFLVKVENYG
jgi:hypothetical protein